MNGSGTSCTTDSFIFQLHYNAAVPYHDLMFSQQEIPMGVVGDAGTPLPAERLRNLDSLIYHISHYDAENARGDLPAGTLSRNNWSENWNRFWNRRDSSGNFAHAAMISYARVVQVLGRFGVRQESRRKFAGLAFSLLGNDNYQPDASTWLGSNFTACFIPINPGMNPKFPYLVAHDHSEMRMYSLVHLAIEARRYSILHDLLTSARHTLGATHFDAKVQLFSFMSGQLLHRPQRCAAAMLGPRAIVKRVWEKNVWPSIHSLMRRGRNIYFPSWSFTPDREDSRPISGGVSLTLFGSIFGVILRTAPSTLAEAFFSHPAVSSAALVDGEPFLGKQRAMFRPFPASQPCAPEAYAGPVPHGSRAVIVPKPKCSWLSMLHMALLRQDYSEKLVTILLHNPALTTVKDLNLRSNFDEGGLPADGLCPKVGGGGWNEERDRWVPDLNPLPILFTSILLGPSRWGAVLQILRHTDLSANHLNFYLSLTESHMDSGGDKDADAHQGRNPATNGADSVFGDSRSDMIRAARTAVMHLVQEGHQEKDEAAEGPQGTLIDHMAPRFKMALAMGGCSALGLLFAVCGPGGVDAAHAAEATPVVLAMLEHPLLDVPKAMGQCGRGPGYNALMERIDIMWPSAAAEGAPQESAGDGVIVARERALGALAQK